MVKPGQTYVVDLGTIYVLAKTYVKPKCSLASYPTKVVLDEVGKMRTGTVQLRIATPDEAPGGGYHYDAYLVYTYSGEHRNITVYISEITTRNVPAYIPGRAGEYAPGVKIKLFEDLFVGAGKVGEVWFDIGFKYPGRYNFKLVIYYG